jgi:hypothetical protein
MSDVDLHAEREIDLGSAWSRIKRRWWLPVLGLVLGAVLGVVVASGGETVWQSKALLYMGQPFTPGGGGQLQSLQTNPKTVSEVISSEAAIQAAAEASGLRRSQLRGNNVASAPVTTTQGATARNLSPLVEITVQSPSAGKSERAAASFANSVITAVSGYTDDKIDLLERQIAFDTAQLARIDQRIEAALRQQEQIANATSLPASERLLAQQSINSNLAVAEAQRLTVQQDLNGAKQLLGLANEVESPQLVQPPTARSTSATSQRNALVIGALIGLLLGALVAYALDPVLRRRAAQATS